MHAFYLIKLSNYYSDRLLKAAYALCGNTP